MDFSEAALRVAARRMPRTKKVRLVVGNIAERLPFPNEHFDGVLSHLSLHYFDTPTLSSIAREVKRVTRPSGLWAIAVKSTDDVYYGEGEPVGPHMYVRAGHLRRFFDEDALRAMLSEWIIDEVWRGNDFHPGATIPSSLLCAIARKD